MSPLPSVKVYGTRGNKPGGYARDVRVQGARVEEEKEKYVQGIPREDRGELLREAKGSQISMGN